MQQNVNRNILKKDSESHEFPLSFFKMKTITNKQKRKKKEKKTA